MQSVSPLVTVHEAAQLLRCARFTVDKLVHTGKLRYQKVGRKNLINREDLVAYIDRGWVREGKR